MIFLVCALTVAGTFVFTSIQEVSSYPSRDGGSGSSRGGSSRGGGSPGELGGTVFYPKFSYRP